jgi:hypothetical protein
MAKLKQHGVAVESDKKLPRKEIAHRVSLMEGKGTHLFLSRAQHHAKAHVVFRPLTCLDSLDRSHRAQKRRAHVWRALDAP